MYMKPHLLLLTLLLTLPAFAGWPDIVAEIRGR